MKTHTTIDFDEAFRELTGNAPFHWQRALYERFSNGDIPKSCSLPTGLGKTSVVAIWLIALAQHLEYVPRRLVYVVNRRTVVDQTTNEVEKYRAALQSKSLETVRDQLADLCALPLDGTANQPASPLALSTLRGQFADNREWSADPTRPAVIVGTVDMIGSRLLFSGYGVGFKAKPLHAGFLGQDVLLVHDEAHLEPAFQDLLIAIEKEQQRCKDFCGLRVMELSATTRGLGKPFELTEEEKNPPDVIPSPPTEPTHVVWRRLTAKKAIHLHGNADEKRLGDQIADLALEKFRDSKQAVIVFLRRVDDVEKVVERLRKAKQEVQQLTGTLRGMERDNLAKEDPIFRRFLAKVEPAEEAVYLVCTSAGEVGVNISADHLVCDLSTFDSMAQRFGRVNRFGDRNDSEIHVVHPNEFDDKNDPEQRRKKTLVLLRALNGNGSSKALGELDPEARRAAFAPTPTILHASDILFDAWALTTIRGKLPGRPMVEPYLHGISGWEAPETHVAWREEVWELRVKVTNDKERVERKVAERNRLARLAAELLEEYPLKPHELLRDRSDRVFKHLAAIAGKRPDLPAWLLDNAGNIEPFTLGELADKDQKERIEYRTILLPPEAGGLLIEKGESRGMLSGTSGYESQHRRCYDVADEWRDEKGQQRRVRVWDNDPQFDEETKGMRLIRRIKFQPDDDEEDEEAQARSWLWCERPGKGDGEGSKSAQKPIPWLEHTDDVSKRAGQIAEALKLSKDLQQAIQVAAKFHDLGKKRELWQRSIGNPNTANWLAKSGKDKSGRLMKPVEMTEYRHEFGSLLDVQNEPEFQALSDDLQDMVLHLIAAHHGRGRPHFPPDEAFDPEPKGQDVSRIAAEVPQRFARLQRKYGRWGLAYLESLLRGADWAASARPS